MEDNSVYCTSKLEHCSYRQLQQIAKSLNLPSNVKKVYLVEMINAKKCSPPSEAERIVRRVKQERHRLTQVKKRSRRTIPLDTSSSESLSPPISQTPKRPAFMLRCSELRHQMMSQETCTVISTPKPNASDRVLRSCNVKLKRPFANKFSEVNQRHVDTVDQASQVYPVGVKKYKPNTLVGSYLSKDRQLVPATQMRTQRIQNSTQIVVKRPRLLSGINPIVQELVPVSGVSVRNSDGKMTPIAAYVYKPKEAKCEQPSSMAMRRNVGRTLRSITNGNGGTHASISLRYPNTSGIIADPPPQYTEVAPEATCSVYYHKKIRAEQVRERRMSVLNTRCELPRINEAFGQFRGSYDRHDVTQPLYVQVSEESERIPNYPQFANRNTALLETMYNFKSNFLTSQPLLQLATTANTKCVYSTPVYATAAPYRPTTIPCAEPYMTSYERDNQYYANTDSSRMNDCLRFAEQDFDFRCSEEQNRSSSSVHSQDLGANVTISDMVEDALELISQDGDYMERMGMDVKTQCVLCDWAGPRIILECHIRKEHANDIDIQAKCEWNITYTLGSVAQQLGQSRVVEFDSALYVLSVKCEPGRFMASLSSITSDPDVTTGSITVFNKVTGEPHMWTGEIQELPPSLPYDTNPGLQIDLARLDLIPNSANLKLVNGELVMQSPTKVVFGQLELNDIHIILFVKVWN